MSTKDEWYDCIRRWIREKDMILKVVGIYADISQRAVDNNRLIFCPNLVCQTEDGLYILVDPFISAIKLVEKSQVGANDFLAYFYDNLEGKTFLAKGNMWCCGGESIVLLPDRFTVLPMGELDA